MIRTTLLAIALLVPLTPARGGDKDPSSTLESTVKRWMKAREQLGKAGMKERSLTAALKNASWKMFPSSYQGSLGSYSEWAKDIPGKHGILNMRKLWPFLLGRELRAKLEGGKKVCLHRHSATAVTELTYYLRTATRVELEPKPQLERSEWVRIDGKFLLSLRPPPVPEKSASVIGPVKGEELVSDAKWKGAVSATELLLMVEDVARKGNTGGATSASRRELVRSFRENNRGHLLIGDQGQVVEVRATGKTDSPVEVIIDCGLAEISVAVPEDEKAAALKLRKGDVVRFAAKLGTTFGLGRASPIGKSRFRDEKPRRICAIFSATGSVWKGE